MVMDLGLPARIRAKGVAVELVVGWETRTTVTGGAQALAALWHHTAGAKTGRAPSLATCIYGRPQDGIGGPLCQVLQTREANPAEDRAIVIAAGRANHAGRGQWGVASGNGETVGLEVEHVGTTSVPLARHEITARILAALLEAPGAARSGAAACRHAEYALPRGRKIDFALTAPIDAGWMRTRTGYWIGRTVGTIPPQPPDQEDTDDMADYMLQAPERPAALFNSDSGNLYKLPDAKSVVAFTGLAGARKVPVVQVTTAAYDSIDRVELQVDDGA